MTTMAELEQGIQDVVAFMKARGVKRVENAVSWKTCEDVPPQIFFDGDESEGLRVVELIREFAGERALIVVGLRREWSYLDQPYPEPPYWAVEFIKPTIDDGAVPVV